MRKVGIVTLFVPENYGNRLQAYALAKTLKKLNCNVVETYYCNGFKSFLKGKIKTNRFLRLSFEFSQGILSREKNAVKKYRRVALFYDFIAKTDVKQVRSSDSSIDFYVCGSDQIWNPTYGGTPYYFANFAPTEKRISYAASFGVNNLPADIFDDYADYLRNMAYISVREHAGAALVRELVDRDVPVVVDPTLLLSREEWQLMSKKPKYDVKKRFVLTYFLGWYPDYIDEYVSSVAEKYDLQIISLNDFKPNDYWYSTGPSEFLWLIENSALVCTNSFHATVFSIIMDRPFVNFRRESKGNDMNSRIETLLGMLGLEDRVYGSLVEDNLFDVDYSHISETLEIEKERSVVFLKNAFGITHNTDNSDE